MSHPQPDGSSPDYQIAAVAKAFSVLEVFEHHHELTQQQIVEQTSLPKASVFRILVTLERVGAVDRTSRGTFTLGTKLVALARSVLSQNLSETARPFLETLMRELGHTVNLAVLDRDHVLFIDCLESRHPFRMTSAVGAREPAHATAVGKAIAAHLPTPQVIAMMKEHPLSPMTPNTVTDRHRLLDELKLIRSRGYSTDLGECYIGCHGVGVPVFNAKGVIGGISVSAPAAQMPRHEAHTIGMRIARESRELSRRLGYRTDQVSAHQSPDASSAVGPAA